MKGAMRKLLNHNLHDDAQLLASLLTSFRGRG